MLEIVLILATIVIGFVGYSVVKKLNSLINLIENFEIKFPSQNDRINKLTLREAKKEVERISRVHGYLFEILRDVIAAGTAKALGGKDGKSSSGKLYGPNAYR